jgi:crotonobetainyl-CoA:carnitine CoA-transferase CaiB-like acyl-CoA transferase
MDSLLSQLKILDFSTLLPGPFATMVLADLGADVVRIESPSRVDLNRINPPFVDEKGSISCSHAYLNRNKRSLALDLKKKESLAVIERLIGTYDIILEQFRPGVMDRLGLSYERLSTINPSLIYCSLTGYGQWGPWSGRVGHDINYLSLSGIMAYSGRKERGPGLMGIQVADVGSGSNNTIMAILAAVIYRMNTGKGQHIDVSMTDGLFPYHAVSALKELYGGQESSYESEVLNGGSLYDFYETADGRYIAFGGLEPQFFETFCKALGLDDMIEGTVLQPGNLENAKERIREIILSRPMNEWIDIFSGVDACVDPVLTFAEAVRTEQAEGRGILVMVPGPGGKEIPQIGHPVKYSAFIPKYRKSGGAVGEDTREVLESAGYDDAHIDEMKSQGIFGDLTI